MNTFGNYLKITLFGASHEPFVGLTADGFSAGIALDLDLIKKRLQNRKGLGALTSKRLEPDEFEIISGYFEGHTTGAPLTILVPNEDVKSEDYALNRHLARPGHVDYVNYVKYQGLADHRGGGVASGRLTVVLIILGAICEQILKPKNLLIASRMRSLGNLKDADGVFSDADLRRLLEEPFPVQDPSVKEKMLQSITQAKEDGDSLGGIVQTFVRNLPVGIGNPFFDGFESLLGHLLLAIPGAKGLEFGDGFSIAGMRGSQANDPMAYEQGKVKFLSNHAGGLNGGLSNGETVVFQTAFRPTPSIGKPQSTIDLVEKKNAILTIQGRHDVIFAIKALHVVNALTNYAILEMMQGR